MRATFIKTLEELSNKNESIYVLTADLGYKLFDNIKRASEERFYDVGVAEANMIGLSAGLSLSGKNVYCYSIVPFLVMRAFEQIRIDIAYHNLNVKLIGVGGGFTYGLEGLTHFGLEDMALMRSLPNMSVVVPADPYEAKRIAELSHEYDGPLYIRLGRTGEPYIYESEPYVRIGKANIIKEGKGIAIFATGNMVYAGKQVVYKLMEKGINATLVNMHTIKPLDTEIIHQIASAHDAIFTVEEHYISGGLGSSVAEVLAESGYFGIFKRIGVNEGQNQHIGSAEYLREQHGLTAESIYMNILKEIKEKLYGLEGKIFQLPASFQSSRGRLYENDSGHAFKRGLHPG